MAVIRSPNLFLTKMIFSATFPLTDPIKSDLPEAGMRFIAMFCMVLLFSAAVSHAIEKAERISDREVIERLAKLDEGQKSLEKRFDDLNNNMNNRFNDVMGLLQILTGAMLVVGGGILGWLIIIWRKLVKVEERQSKFETQDDEIKFLKEAYSRLNEMVLKLMDVLRPPKGIL